MNASSYLKNINPKMKAIVTLVGLIVVGIILGYVFSLISLEIIMSELHKLPIQIPLIRIERSITYYTAALICLAIQITLLIGLLYAYVDSYRQTKSEFLIGLNMFIIALLIRSILSVVSLHNIATEYIRFTPFVSRTFLTLGFSELNFVVYIFEIIALSILLYLSLK